MEGQAAYPGPMAIEARPATDDVATMVGPKRPDANGFW
jgi:hypothetical protein